MNRNAFAASPVYETGEFEVIADEQITRLREQLANLVEQGKATLGQVGAILTTLVTKRDAAIAKIADVSIVGCQLPLLPAISKNFLAASIQMSMLRYGRNTGMSYLVDELIIDEVTLPRGCAWWLIGVEDGEQFFGGQTTPKHEAFIINGHGRFCVVAAEAMALGIHTDVLLRRHNLTAYGSRFKQDNGVVCVSLDSIKPWLGRSRDDQPNGKWCTVSCAGRV